MSHCLRGCAIRGQCKKKKKKIEYGIVTSSIYYYSWMFHLTVIPAFCKGSPVRPSERMSSLHHKYFYKVTQGSSQGNISVDPLKLDNTLTTTYLSVLKSMLIIDVQCALSLAISIQGNHQCVRVLSH